MKALPLKKVNDEISACFEQAEKAVRERAAILGPCTETEITFLLREHLTVSVSTASSRGLFEKALEKDLSEGFRFSGKTEKPFACQRMCDGLSGQVIWHSMQVEGGPRRKVGPTGADFGIVLSRPVVPWEAYGSSTTSTVGRERRGLLVQAKLKKPGKRSFGGFTKPQQKVYDDRSGYLVLLRYEYLSPDDLGPMRWSSCQGRGLATVTRWLGVDGVPKAEDKGCRDVITRLGAGTLGTSDDTVINGFIEVQSCPALEIVIDWPDGKRPGSFEISEALRGLKEAKTHVPVSVELTE